MPQAQLEDLQARAEDVILQRVSKIKEGAERLPFLVFISRPEIGCHLNNLKDGKANRTQKET